MSRVSELERLREKTEEKQRATIWPDTLGAARTVDEFLWKGDVNATPIQRAGLVIFASIFLFSAFGFGVFILSQASWSLKLEFLPFGLIALVVGVRLARNAFRRQKRDSARRP